MLDRQNIFTLVTWQDVCVTETESNFVTLLFVVVVVAVVVVVVVG